ncbi:MAG TPA: hypothetical protein VKR52_02945 [Terracidiphilus sp.]|nr:hypothetical protein [Terracidiphilus sp.]
MSSRCSQLLRPAVDCALSVRSSILNAAIEFRNQVERDRALRRNLDHRLANIEAALEFLAELANAKAGSAVDVLLPSPRPLTPAALEPNS